MCLNWFESSILSRIFEILIFIGNQFLNQDPWLFVLIDNVKLSKNTKNDQKCQFSYTLHWIVAQGYSKFHILQPKGIVLRLDDLRIRFGKKYFMKYTDFTPEMIFYTF